MKKELLFAVALSAGAAVLSGQTPTPALEKIPTRPSASARLGCPRSSATSGTSGFIARNPRSPAPRASSKRRVSGR